MKLTFYYVRHGKTLFNTAGRMQGTCDSPLTAAGIHDTEDTASALRHVHFDRAYCSSAERAKDTAAILLRGRNMKAVPMKELKEFSYGSYDGEYASKIMDRLQKEYFNEDWSDVGGENLESFSERSAKAFDRMVSEAKDGDTILIAGHGSYFVHLIKTLLHLDREAYITSRKEQGRPIMPNCGIAVLTYEDGVYTMTQEPVTAQEYRKIYQKKHVNYMYVRHGQTIFNIESRMQGRCDSPLTEKGIEQAEMAALRIRNRRIARAYVSPSERAVDTAAILLQYHHGLQTEEEPRLHEVNYGTFEACNYQECWEEVNSRHETEDWTDFGGENKEQIEQRLKDLLRDTADEAEDGDTVLFVSHGNLYLNLIEVFGTKRSWLYEQAAKNGTNPMPNCGLFEFSYDTEEGFKVIHWMNEA